VAAIVWVDLRDANGKLMGRYDPKRRLLEIQHRRVKTIFDFVRCVDAIWEKVKHLVLRMIAQTIRDCRGEGWPHPWFSGWM